MKQADRSQQQKAKGAPGKTSLAVFAFDQPKASAQKLHQTIPPNENPSQQNQEGLDRFFGASSVASALGVCSGATPHKPNQSNILFQIVPPKPDISTLLGLGHFYFALTEPVSSNSR
jgi:hypothetical protein